MLRKRARGRFEGQADPALICYVYRETLSLFTVLSIKKKEVCSRIDLKAAGYETPSHKSL